MNTRIARSIITLPEQLEGLAGEERERFARLFSVVRSRGSLVPPPEMEPWIEKAFGSVGAVQAQSVVKTLNLWTLEGALFNDLRARRPVDNKVDAGYLSALDGDGSDAFCNPLTGTPADTFGRVQGRFCTTASNVAKYDGLHSVIILKEHNPLRWSGEQVGDAFATAEKWLQEAHSSYPSAIYPFIMWNCLPRSGASIVHAHMQVALGEGIAFARVELWRRAAAAYRAQSGRDYFEDFYAAHRSLGLAGAFPPPASTGSEPEKPGAANGPAVRWLAHLTPIKEKELILLSPSLGPDLYAAIYSMLKLYVETLGVRAFNVAIYMPPIVPVQEDWTGFPVIVRMVDRGDPASATSDIGAMELFAQPVVAFDPWKLAATVTGH
jgi:hypothetical protein